MYEELQRLLQQVYRLPLLSAASVDPIWRAGGLRMGGRWTSVADLQAQAAAPIAQAILAEVERAAGDLRLWEAVLLTGGGAQVLGGHLQLAMQTIVAAEPAYGNACGYFKRQVERARAGA